ncbi:MAG: type II toxin-antitoxin system RelE/ParE family toxin, partial [Desulfamplus sp.]|nr:type II toxin-antitoxin system RelE/ParE family toxin [Desulfamplus sp.]
MNYNIEYTPAALKQLFKLDKSVAKSIVDYMESISPNPMDFGKALRKGYRGYWRHRVGDYRV